MIEKPLAKIMARDRLSEEEQRLLRDAVVEVRHIGRDRTVMQSGDEPQYCTLLLDGMMSRYRDLPSGVRQISQLHVPGDFVDLHSFVLKRLDHSLRTVSPCTVAIVPHSRLLMITEQHPHLARVLWFATALDATIHREWLLSIGKRSAIGRVAHLFCELDVRLGLVGLSHGHRFALPLTQEEVGECTGITTVHTNRVLKELRNNRLVTFRHRELVIHDVEGLRRVAGFDPLYLCLSQRDR